MVAIHTKFIGPTNTRGSRYKAYTTKDRKTVTVNAAQNLDNEQNHNAAAIAYCKMMGWSGKLISGGTDEGYVYVFLPRSVQNMMGSLEYSDIITIPGVTK